MLEACWLQVQLLRTDLAQRRCQLVHWLELGGGILGFSFVASLFLVVAISIAVHATRLFAELGLSFPIAVAVVVVFSIVVADPRNGWRNIWKLLILPLTISADMFWYCFKPTYLRWHYRRKVRSNYVRS